MTKKFQGKQYPAINNDSAIGFKTLHDSCNSSNVSVGIIFKGKRITDWNDVVLRGSVPKFD